MTVRRALDELTSPIVTKIGVHQKHSVDTANLGERVTVFDAIGGDGKSASGDPVAFSLTRLGVKIDSNEYVSRTHTLK